MLEGVISVEEVWQKWGSELVAYAAVLAGPSDADDVTAEAIARLLAVDPADLDRGVFTRPYVRRVVLNEVRMRARQRVRRERREWKVSLERLPDHVELLRDPRVVAALRELSVMQRAVVFFTYWEDLPPEAVAVELGVSSGTVKRHLARARHKLREVL